MERVPISQADQPPPSSEVGVVSGLRKLPLSPAARMLCCTPSSCPASSVLLGGGPAHDPHITQQGPAHDPLRLMMPGWLAGWGVPGAWVWESLQTSSVQSELPESPLPQAPG